LRILSSPQGSHWRKAEKKIKTFDVKAKKRPRRPLKRHKKRYSHNWLNTENLCGSAIDLGLVGLLGCAGVQFHDPFTPPQRFSHQLETHKPVTVRHSPQRLTRQARLGRNKRSRVHIPRRFTIRISITIKAVSLSSKHQFPRDNYVR
jgi:hypothetical protein